MPWGTGPVFAAECRASARRWQVYAARVALVGMVLGGLLVVHADLRPDSGSTTARQQAEVARRFVGAVFAVELVLALVLVPAAAAGAFCHDKMSGALTLLMVTDLSDAEIVLGRMASRLVSVFAVLACGLPVLAIATFLGGADPVLEVGATLVIAGVCVLGVAVALTFSVWARRPQESLLATYAAWAVWLLALLGWSETSRSTTPDFLYGSNPFYLVFGGSFGAGPSPGSRAWFFAGCLVVSALLAAVCVRSIRRVTLVQASRGVSARRRPAWGWSPRSASLDADPVLWREWHRGGGSAWNRWLWRLFAAVSLLFVGLSLAVNHWIGPGTGGFMVSFGLLLVTIHAATALAEERAHGSLDVLLTTPLSTLAIVRAKWWGAFRPVPALAVLPALLAFGLRWDRAHGVVSCLIVALALAAMVLTYGAIAVSVGLACATRQPRLGRAVGLTVGLFLAATVIYPSVTILLTRAGPQDPFILWPSPFFGVFQPLSWAAQNRIRSDDGGAVTVLLWSACAAAFARAVLGTTVRSFDRKVGRMPERRAEPDA